MSESVHTHVIHTDGDVAVSIRTTRRELFFSFMHWIVDTGRLRDMSGTAAKVYLAIGRFCDFKARTCQVSTARIARAAGVSRASVFGVLPELMRLGVLECETGQTDSDTRAAAPNRYKLPGRIPQGGSKNPIAPIQNLDGPLSKKPAEPYPESGHLLERQERETAAATPWHRAAAITGQTHAAAVHLLSRGGMFSEADARKLAKLADGDLAVVRAAMARLQQQRKNKGLTGTAYGFVAAAIKGRWGADDTTQVAEQRQQTIDQQARERAAEREALRQQAERDRLELGAIRAQLAGLPAQQIAEWTALVLEELPRTQRARLINGKFDVTTSETLARGVWHCLQGQRMTQRVAKG